MTRPQLVTADYERQINAQQDQTLGPRTFVDAGAFGGGGDDGMNDLRTRVVVLEAHTEAIRDDIRDMKPALQDVRERFARLEEGVKHLPTKGSVWTGVALIIGAIFLVTAFQGAIQAYLGVASSIPQ